MVGVAGANQINLQPNNEVNFAGELSIKNNSRFTILVAYEQDGILGREVTYRFLNDLGREIESNILPGRAIKKIEVIDSGNGIAFNYFLNN